MASLSGNVGLHSRDFHGESYYDVPALTADPRFRDSMRLITQYSLLPFMTPRQFYYPRVVLQFYHSMTSRGAPSPLELQFSIDDRSGVLRATDISAALGLPPEQANSGGLSGLASTNTEGDGPLSRSRHYAWTSTLQEAAPTLDASR